MIDNPHRLCYNYLWITYIKIILKGSVSSRWKIWVTITVDTTCLSV